MMKKIILQNFIQEFKIAFFSIKVRVLITHFFCDQIVLIYLCDLILVPLKLSISIRFLSCEPLTIFNRSNSVTIWIRVWYHQHGGLHHSSILWPLRLHDWPEAPLQCWSLYASHSRDFIWMSGFCGRHGNISGIVICVKVSKHLNYFLRVLQGTLQGKAKGVKIHE